MNDQEFFTAEEAAEMLGVQVRTLYLYIRQGKFDAKKIGKSFRIPKQEIYDYMSLNRTKGVLIVKVGTQVLLDDENDLDLNVLKRYSQDISKLQRDGWQVVLVSSGAMGAGKEVFQGESIKDNILRKQVLAAVGQARLMHYYADFFAKQGYKVAQALLERDNFSNRNRFLSIRSVITESLNNGIIPIVNENDVIADKELRFGDNDELASLLAVMMDAKKLMVCSSVEGLYDCDPTENKCAQVVKEVSEVSEETFEMCGGSVSEHGMGGMYSKLQASKVATQAGIETYVIDGKRKNNLIDAVNGEDFVGTKFLAKKGGLKSFKKWLHAGALSFGKIVVDHGAYQALMKKKSLLLVGVISVEGDFEEKDTIDVYTEKGENVAIGLSGYSSKELKESLRKMNKKDQKPVIHVDNLLIL